MAKNKRWGKKFIDKRDHKKYQAELLRRYEIFVDLDWVDFQPRNGKVGGAFCSNIPSIKESRVLLNFTEGKCQRSRIFRI